MRDPPCVCRCAVFADRPLLIVVEGVNDVQFLTRLSRRLAMDNPAVPDLAALSESGQIVFVPFGGGNPLTWTQRLAPLGCREFHLYDRELPPETDTRVTAAAQVNARSDCRAFVTRRRTLEHALHPRAIEAAGGGVISFHGNDCVATVLAQHWFQRTPQAYGWDKLARRQRQKLIQRAKRWLNTAAVEHMTKALLAERDPQDEVLHWFETIHEMLPSSLTSFARCS